jgi:hypothetical protein
MEKTKQLYVLLALADYCFIITSFDLWMLKRVYDISSLVINFWGVINNQNIMQLGFLKHLIPLGMH